MARRATALRKIRVMISSQCNRAFPDGGRTLSEIRQQIRDRLEAQDLLGQKLFEVWINEDAPGRGTDVNSWDACLLEVRKADVLVVLDAGHGGWAPSDGDIGICHAELMTAHDASPAKVRVIRIVGSEAAKDELAKTNSRFRSYVDRINPFRASVTTEEGLIQTVDEAVVDAVSSLVGLGIREAGKGGYSSGDALVWSRLSFTDRAQRMRTTLVNSLRESGGTPLLGDRVMITVASEPVVLHLHAAPASLTISASRELVGRPFLADHLQIADYPDKAVGPIHVIACQGGVTEAQARSMLGFPDASFITPAFGIFASDGVQQIQFALLRNCRDDTTIRSAVHRFLDWLVEAGEDELMVQRARRRLAIAQAIAAQYCTTAR